MDIAALSIVLSQGKIQQQASISVMKMAMGAAADQGNFIADMANGTTKAIELAVRPYLGVNIDLQA